MKKQIRTDEDRKRMVKEVEALKATGEYNYPNACKKIGMSVGSFHAWRNGKPYGKKVGKKAKIHMPIEDKYGSQIGLTGFPTTIKYAKKKIALTTNAKCVVIFCRTNEISEILAGAGL